MSFPYRYIQDVTIRYEGLPELMPEKVAVGLACDEGWIWRMVIASPHSTLRWVAPPEEGIIDCEARRVFVECQPPCDGMLFHTIFDAEPDRTCYKRSPLDLRIQWGEAWEFDVPWWLKRPKIIWIRRRIKRARLYAENAMWCQGRAVVTSFGPLDPRDDND